MVRKWYQTYQIIKPKSNSAVTKQTFIKGGFMCQMIKSVGFNHGSGWLIMAWQSTHTVMFTFLGKTITLSIKHIYKED
jgi:hypothetical protein